MRNKIFAVYIITNELHTVLYIVMTSNLPNRIFQHKEKLVEGFTKKYNVSKFIYYETTESAEAAIAREKQLKGWSREKKIKLIENKNPFWKDLSKSLQE